MQITYNGITIPFFDVEECKNLDNVKLGENGLPEQVSLNYIPIYTVINRSIIE